VKASPKTYLAGPSGGGDSCRTMTGQLTIIQPGEILVAETDLVLPTLIAAAGDRAAGRYVEFFTAKIRNSHTRRAYGRAATEFLTCHP
jgi:hypothetical protein